VSVEVKVDIDTAAIMQEVRQCVNPGLRAVAAEVATRARNTAAFVDKTGNLRRSIRVEDPGPESPFVLVKAGDYAHSGAGETYAPHAHLIEYGHAKVTPGGRVVGFTPARPFMGPAAEEVLQRADEIVAAAMRPVDIEVG
jgi:hypothetical protein